MFLIHPADLDFRRKRCRPFKQAVAALRRETLSECNICQSDKTLILCQQDRYGLPIRTALCRNCGLIYLVDRLKAESYDEFYAGGMYRDISTSFHGVNQKLKNIQTNQSSYAAQLADALAGFVARVPNGQLLDVGGSTGSVASAFQARLGYRATVIDPSADEIAEARAAGLDAVQGSLETWNTDQQFDLIILCRSVEHLHDLKGSLTKIHKLLSPTGRFYVDINDFPELCRLVGPPEAVTKVDHCFWLSQDAAPGIFRALGWEIVSTVLFSQAQVGFLLRKSDSVAIEPRAEEWVANQVRIFQQMDREWFAQSQSSPNFKLWLRRKLYRLKRRVRNLWPEVAATKVQSETREGGLAA